MTLILDVELPDARATEALGAVLGERLGRGGVVYLVGDLGAGKTCLARGLLRARGVVGAVRSPTYTLMEPYSLSGGEVLHMDLYRLAAPEELLQLGLGDFPPADVLWLVEWPERGEGLLPPPDLRIELQTSGSGRKARLQWGPGAGMPPDAAQLQAEIQDRL